MPRTLAELAQHTCRSYTLSAMQGSHHWAFGTEGDIRVAINGDLLAAAVAGQGII